MKPTLSIFVLVILLASCIKGINNLPVAVKPTVPKQVTVVHHDTVPDGGSFKVKIQKDSLSVDETMVIFDHTASTMYINTQDAVYFPGYGIANIASLTSDGIPCAIQKLPYIQENPIGLSVKIKNDGIYILNLSYLNLVPPTIHVWLKDKYMQDSLDMRVGNYAFQVIKSDTNTYGTARFKVVLR
jgi:hypothetical protein